MLNHVLSFYKVQVITSSEVYLQYFQSKDVKITTLEGDSVINQTFIQQLHFLLFGPTGDSFNFNVFLVQDQKDRVYSTVRSRSTSATVNNLKPSTAYVFQIRAFTEAGYGTFGPRLEITTKEEATGRINTQATHARTMTGCFTCALHVLYVNV